MLNSMNLPSDRSFLEQRVDHSLRTFGGRLDEDEPGLSVFVAEHQLAPGARVESVQIQSEGSERIHVTSSHARLAANARFESHVFSLGTGLVRSELSVTLDEPGAETRMRGFVNTPLMGWDG